MIRLQNKTISRDVIIKSGSNEFSNSRKKEDNCSKLQGKIIVLSFKEKIIVLSFKGKIHIGVNRMGSERNHRIGVHADHSLFTLEPGVQDRSIAPLTHMTIYRGEGTRSLTFLLLARTSCCSVVGVSLMRRHGQFLHFHRLIFAAHARCWSMFSKQRDTILRLPFSLRSLEKTQRPARLFAVSLLIYEFAGNFQSFRSIVLLGGIVTS